MRHVLIGIGGFFFPGLGHAVAGRRNLTIAFAAGAVLAYTLAIFSVWFIAVAMLTQLAAAIHGAMAARRSDRERRPSNTTLIIVAVAISVVGALTVRVFGIEAFKIPSSSMHPTLVIGDHVLVDKLSKHWRDPERGEVIVFTQPCTTQTWIKRVMAVAGDTIEVRCNVVYVNGKALPSKLVAERQSYKELDDGGQWFARETSHYRETVDDRTFDIYHDVDRPLRDRQRANDPYAAADDDRGDFPQNHILRTCGTQHEDGRPSAAQARGKIVMTVATPTNRCTPQQHFVVPERSLFVMGDHRNNANDSRFWGVVPLDNVIGRTIGIWWPLGRAGGIE